MILALATAAAAPLPLGLADALRLVEERSATLDAQELQVAIAHVAATRARLDRATATVVAGADAGVGFLLPPDGPLADTEDASWSARATGSVVLWSGGRVDAAIAQADAAEAATAAGVASTLRDLQQATYTAYWNVKGIELSIGATEDGLQASREALAIIEAKAAAGLAADLDVNRSRVDLVAQEADLLSQRQQQFAAEQDLCRLLQLEDTDPVLTDELPTDPVTDPVTLPEGAGADRPELASLAASRAQAEAQRRAARAAALPAVSATATLGAGGAAQGVGPLDPAGGDLRPTTDGRIGLTASWNPFDLLRVRQNVSRAALSVQQVDANTAAQRLAIATQIRVAASRVDVLRAQVPFVRQQLDLASSNLQIVQDLYAQGNTTILDLFSAQAAFRSARLRQAGLLVQLRLAEVDLAWALADDLVPLAGDP